MPVTLRRLLLALLPLALPAVVAAQSPTLPSDTLEANFAPRSEPGPTPELAPSLPSDTLHPGELVVPPDTAAAEMRRDWDQGEEAGEPWRTEEEADEMRREILHFKLG